MLRNTPYHDRIRQTRSTTLRAGFTLVELLVVIGVIALLISILLPALTRARESANRVNCASNQRQILLGLHMYLSDHQGAFMPDTLAASNRTNTIENRFSNPKRLIGMGVLIPYVGYSRVFFCPSYAWAPPSATPNYPAADLEEMIGNFLDVDKKNKELWSTYAFPLAPIIFKRTNHDHQGFSTWKLKIPARVSGWSNFEWNDGTRTSRIPIIGDEKDDGSERRRVYHNGLGYNVGYLDGSARWIPVDAFPTTVLSGQRNTMMHHSSGNMMRFWQITAQY